MFAPSPVGEGRGEGIRPQGLALTFLFSFLPPPTLFFFLAAAIITLMALQRKTLWITNFCEEVKENLSLLDEVEQAAKTVKGSERSWQRAGHEYTLWMDGEEVMVRANQLEFSGDEMEEGMSYYDEESLSLCGVEDFLQVVNAYREFMKQR